MAMAPAGIVKAQIGARLKKYAPTILNTGMQLLGNRNENKLREAESAAINNYLNSMDARRAGLKQDFTKDYQEAEKQFLTEANTALPELVQAKQDIQEAATEQQQAANQAMQAQLAQQGVRGGQAATLLNRGTGQLGREALRDINTLGYQEAAGRQGARLDYGKTKTLIPYQTRYNQWLNMPSDREQAMALEAINRKFGR
jgi:hypothetical protein